jgi:hypothetical protein
MPIMNNDYCVFLSSVGLLGCSLRNVILNDRILNGRYLNDRLIDGNLLNNRILNGRCLNDRLIDGSFLNGRCLRDGPLDGKCVEKNVCLIDKLLNGRCLNNRISNGSLLNSFRCLGSLNNSSGEDRNDLRMLSVNYSNSSIHGNLHSTTQLPGILVEVEEEECLNAMTSVTLY